MFAGLGLIVSYLIQIDMFYSIKLFPCLFVTFLFICFLGCQPEPIPVLEQVSVSERIFNCGQYNPTALGSGLNALDNALVSSFGPYIVLVQDGKIELRTQIDADPVWQQALEVKKMLPWGDKLLILANSGIFSLDQAQTLSLLLEQAVDDIAIGPEDEILFIDQANPPYRVFELSQPDNQIINYTEPYNASLCAAPERLLVAENGEIWLINCNRDLVFYTTNDQAYVFEGEYAFIPGREQATSITTNAAGPADLMYFKYGAEEVFLYQWHESGWKLIWESNFRAADPLLTQIRLSSPNDIFSLGNTIYLSTNSGVVRFRQNEVGGAITDYDIVQDPNLPEDAVFQIYERESGLFYVSNTANVVEIDCR